MSRFILLTTTLAACSYESTPTTAEFHGQVGQGVTHVMAVSPVWGDLQKVVAPVDNQSFSVDVEPGRPWALVFVDSNKRGADMVTGVLRSDTLDTFLPKTGGEIDLGQISIDGRDATMAGSSESLDNALALSRRTLATIGGLDDIALRYANPDVDADGIIDTDENRSAKLELHVEYALTAVGRAATPDDFITHAPQVGYDHVGTGIYGRLPQGFALDKASASVTFEQPYWGYESGPYTAAVAAGTPITSLTFGNGGSFGVYTRPDHPVPSGNYHFTSGHDSMDFTLVRPPAEMVMHQVMPRIHLVPAVADCTHNCVIDSIEWAWQRSTEDGWVTITDEEAGALQPQCQIDIISAAGNRQYNLLPTATGTIPWEKDIYRAPTLKSSAIDYMQFTFGLQPGMKMFASAGAVKDHPTGMGDLSDFTASAR